MPIVHLNRKDVKVRAQIAQCRLMCLGDSTLTEGFSWYILRTEGGFWGIPHSQKRVSQDILRIEGGVWGLPH